MDGIELVAREVSVAGPHEPLVVAPDFVARAGTVTYVGVDPGVATVALALALGGRIELLTGHIELDGLDDTAHRRAHTVLVDVEDVTAPEESLPVHAVVAEEMSLRGLPSGREAVRQVLADHHLLDRRSLPWERVPADDRTALLIEIAASATSPVVLVVAGPDRHGGESTRWQAAAQDAARRAGHTVVALVSPAAATTLSVKESK